MVKFYSKETEFLVNDFAVILEKHLIKNYKYKDPRVWTSWKRVFALRIKYDIMLRFPPKKFLNYNNCIVIARLSFRKKRAGNGTSFLKLVCNYAKKKEIKYIGIEMAQSKSIKNFAKKFGFKSIKDDLNWIIETKSLVKNLISHSKN